MTESEFQKLAELLDENLAATKDDLDERFDGLAKRPDSHDERFDRLDERVRRNGVTIEHVRDEVNVVAERVTGVVQEMAAVEGRLSDRIGGVKEEVQFLARHVWPPVENHEERIPSLED